MDLYNQLSKTDIIHMIMGSKPSQSAIEGGFVYKCEKRGWVWFDTYLYKQEKKLLIALYMTIKEEYQPYWEKLMKLSQQ